MSTADVIQAISAGICFYAGVLHLMVGWRSRPRDRVHLTFAVTSILYGIYSVALFVLYRVFESGSLARYVLADRWGISVYYMAQLALFWFIATYAGARRGPLLWVITGLYVAIALLCFVLPYPWVYTDIELTSAFPPDIVVAPWYSVEQVVTWVLLVVYTGYHGTRLYRRGEREAATALGVAMGIYLGAILWDYGIEYGLIDTVLMAQYGFVAFVVIMSLRLSSEAVEAMVESRRLNVELEQRVEARTAELSNANQDLVRARDAAEAANRAKSTFLANMSHELRTPLNAILGFAQIMQRAPDLPEQQQENLEVISHSGEHLLELINDVLEISRIEAGQSTLDVSAFDLHRMLDTLESTTGMRAESKGLELTFERQVDLPRYIRTDQRKLRQVLINLLGNAVKFTSKGRVVLQVSVGDDGRQTMDDPETQEKSSVVGRRSSLVFEVRDTGPGIAPEEMDALFEPFSQTQSGRRTGEGTGLGLPISRRFVELMSGEIGVRSQVGQGSTFSFEIPLALADPSELAPARPMRRVVGLAPDQRALGGAPYRILVADDSAENRALLRQLLAQVGFAVRTAVNGQEAVEIARTWEPHLIWMDLRMPVLDGYQATRQIRAGDGPETVVIAVTASAYEEERARVLEAGCDDFVRKPFTEAVIFAKMAEHLGVRYVYEELATPVDEAEAAPPATGLAAADLVALPEDWLVDLRQSAMAGRAERLHDLIAQIEPEHAPLAAALRALVEDYQFRRIVALAEGQR